MKEFLFINMTIAIAITVLKIANGPVSLVSSASTKLKAMSYRPSALVTIAVLAFLGIGLFFYGILCYFIESSFPIWVEYWH